MKINNKVIKEALLKQNYITEKDAKDAEDFAKKNNTSFLGFLFSKNLITKDLLGQAIAESLNVFYADLNSIVPEFNQIKKVPERIAQKYRVVLFKEEKDKIVVTTDDLSEDILPIIQEIFPEKKISIAYSLKDDIDAVLKKYQKPLDTRFNNIIKKSDRVVPDILEEIFKDALSYYSSDIHFEPNEEYVLVRFRVDGVLKEAGKIPREYYENILNRIKVESNLRIDEHLKSQDGSFRYYNKEKGIDFRTSIIPTIKGEKIVLRIISAYTESFSLGALGLSFEQEKLIKETARKPFGMIVVAGPTGSGKTTTLYGLLKEINSPDINITTIEDPVEYKLSGANQIQVNYQSGLTFSKGLRSIVRQDPDVILVGEIRDIETAEIAVNAALTGHILFSTFHANDACSVIPRLIDMGVEPFILASTLEVIVAQRLIRKICEECRISIVRNIKNIEASKSEIFKKFFSENNITLYEGRGCDVCNYTGYRGRTAIFEFIKITPAIEDIILKRPSAKEINETARREGTISLFEDGIEKVKLGITTIEELMRVVDFK